MSKKKLKKQPKLLDVEVPPKMQNTIKKHQKYIATRFIYSTHAYLFSLDEGSYLASTWNNGYMVMHLMAYAYFAQFSFIQLQKNRLPYV